MEGRGEPRDSPFLLCGVAVWLPARGWSWEWERLRVRPRPHRAGELSIRVSCALSDLTQGSFPASKSNSPAQVAEGRSLWSFRDQAPPIRVAWLHGVRGLPESGGEDDEGPLRDFYGPGSEVEKVTSVPMLFIG